MANSTSNANTLNNPISYDNEKNKRETVEKTSQQLSAIEENDITSDQSAIPTDKNAKGKVRKNRELNKLEDTPIIQSRLRSESGKVYSSTVTVDSHPAPEPVLEILQEEPEMCLKDCCKKSDQIISMITRLQSSIDDITNQFSTQKTLQTTTSTKVEELEDTSKKHESEIEDLQLELNEAKFQIKLITNIVTRQDQQIGFLSKKITDMQQREMAANIVISGIPESKSDKPLQLFNSFVSNQLEIQELIPANKAYRIGAGSSRPLLVELRDKEQKRKLFANATKLRGKKNNKGGFFFLAEHLPEQLNEERRRVNELFSENKKKPAGFQLDMEIKKGALKINQEPYKKAVEVPTMKNIVRPSEALYEKVEDIDIVKGAEESQANSKFSSFAVAVKDLDDINAAYLKIKMKFADATHVSCAYRLPGANTPTNQDYVDDGEFGCGRTILKAIKDQQLMNVAVFVLRYYGGTHLGPQRFDIFRSLADQAINRLLKARKQQGEEITPVPDHLKIPTAPEGWSEIEEDWSEVPTTGKKTN